MKYISSQNDICRVKMTCALNNNCVSELLEMHVQTIK